MTLERDIQAFADDMALTEKELARVIKTARRRAASKASTVVRRELRQSLGVANARIKKRVIKRPAGVWEGLDPLPADYIKGAVEVNPSPKRLRMFEDGGMPIFYEVPEGEQVSIQGQVNTRAFRRGDITFERLPNGSLRRARASIEREGISAMNTAEKDAETLLFDEVEKAVDKLLSK